MFFEQCKCIQDRYPAEKKNWDFFLLYVTDETFEMELGMSLFAAFVQLLCLNTA